MRDIPIDNVLPLGATLQDIYVNDSDDLESIGRQLEGYGWHGAGQACTQLWQQLTDQVERNPRTEVICAKITFESHDHEAAPVVLGRVMLFSVGGIYFARALVVFSELECEKEALLALYAMADQYAERFSVPITGNAKKHSNIGAGLRVTD